MYQDGYLCHLCDQIMGETADLLGEKYKIARTASDEYALMSQLRYKAAAEAGRFVDELVPVEVAIKRETLVIEIDEHPRTDATIAGLSKLKPVFKESGTVTAGNASGITDGAASLLVFSEEKKNELN